MAKHSTKKSAQLLSKALQKAGIKDIIISPGSRNAPLIIEFTSAGFFNNYSIIDERVAGFFALGMAQQKQQPVVLVCTSGSALLNYYPAVAEAFYSHIPLIVVSADRPQKWVDQGEGQTIRQHNVFKNHSWLNATLSEVDSEQNFIQVKKAIETAIEKRGPVHLNIPFDEPLYEQVEIEEAEIGMIQTEFPAKIYEESDLQPFEKLWQSARKKMILVGQHPVSEFLQLQLEKMAEDPSVIVLHENIANVSHEKFVGNIDQAIFSLDETVLSSLKPDILMTIGRNIVSKKVKQFLRKYPPKAHWHIEQTDLPPNTFEVLSQHFKTTPEMFLSQFLFLVQPVLEAYYQQKWLEIKRKHQLLHQKFLKQTGFSDLKAFELISQNIPESYMVQWGNSSTIRYAQLFNYKASITHFSNRGTSGIDGATSTAMGAATAAKIPTVLVTGDISFLYDRNGLWHKYLSPDFKIILINNGGGDIFNFIPGPSKTEALNDFFVTKHQFEAEALAKMHHLAYQKIDNLRDLKRLIKPFLENRKTPALLEIKTQTVDNAGILKAYFESLK